jgi:hypothetical protein
VSARLRVSSLAGVLAVAFIASIYLATLQTDVSGGGSIDMLDVGELQVALSAWGTAHPTGYPFFTIAGNLMVVAGRLAGLAPALMTSLLSALASLGTVALVYVMVWQLTHRTAAALAALALVALSPTFWLNSVITEVYALNVVLIVCLLYLAWRAQQGDRVPPAALALMAGLALTHHRTAVLVLPSLLLLLWPREWPKFTLRRALPVALAFLAPFALYAYIPLRIIQKGPWIYEQQRWGLAEPISFTFNGFVQYVMAREYTSYVHPITTLAELNSVSLRLAHVWTSEVGILALLAGIAGLVLAVFSQQRRLALSLLLLLAVFGVFGLFYQVRALAEMLLPTIVVLSVGAGLFVGWIARRLGVVPALVLAAILVLSVAVHVPAQWKDITSKTKNTAGRQLIDAALRIPDPCPTILSHWGDDWFAYHYAYLSSHELACAHIEPPHADIRQDWAAGERVYTASHFLYQMPLADLEAEVGPLHMQSAGYGMIQLESQPPMSSGDQMIGPPVDMGGVMTLMGYELEPSADGQQLYLSLYWRADTPERLDYSVFVHVSDKSAIASPDDIVSQADSLNPVYGWYPTSRWVQGEIVRDDYLITENLQRPAKMISVGMYRSEGSGFSNLGSREIMVGGNEGGQVTQSTGWPQQ